MRSWKKSVPAGTKDILFKDCAQKMAVEEKLRSYYLNRGYLQVITPTLEYYDVFDNENVWIEQEKMYKLFDSNGRILVMRPDITAPVARIAATKLKDSYYPIKLCYSLNVFRNNEILNGKSDEFTQSGVEIIGSDSLRSDIELIITAIKALMETGIKDFKIEMGQIEFFKGIMEDTNLDSEDIEKIRSYIEDKNFATLNDYLDSREDLDKETIKLISTLPRLFGGIEVIEEARTLTTNKKALEALNIIEEIYKVLEAMGFDKYFTVDLGMVHHIDYYTGVIFRAYVEGAGKDVLYGGRYNSLIGSFGLDVPATGFALDVDAIVDILNREKLLEVDLSGEYLICYDYSIIEKANALADKVRDKGHICELSLYEKMEDNIKYAEARKIKKIIVISSTEEDYIYDVNSKVNKPLNWGEYFEES